MKKREQVHAFVLRLAEQGVDVSTIALHLSERVQVAHLWTCMYTYVHEGSSVGVLLLALRMWVRYHNQWQGLCCSYPRGGALATHHPANHAWYSRHSFKHHHSRQVPAKYEYICTHGLRNYVHY